MECVLDESGTDEAECNKKVVRERRIGGPIRSLVKTWGLQFQYAGVLHKSLLIPIFMYGSETMIWKKENCRIRAVQGNG